MSREHCINATAEEIRSYLAGTLTEARRPVKGIPPEAAFPATETDFSRFMKSDSCLVFDLMDEDGHHYFGPSGLLMQGAMRCPFGRPGDVLVFRETWQAINVYASLDVESGEHLFVVCKRLPDHDDGWWDIFYKATDPQGNDSVEDRGFSWRYPATMPRWAARIRATIASVRVAQTGDGREWVIGLEAKP